MSKCLHGEGCVYTQGESKSDSVFAEREGVEWRQKDRLRGFSTFSICLGLHRASPQPAGPRPEQKFPKFAVSFPILDAEYGIF